MISPVKEFSVAFVSVKVGGEIIFCSEISPSGSPVVEVKPSFRVAS